MTTQAKQKYTVEFKENTVKRTNPIMWRKQPAVRATLVNDALIMAIWKRKPAKDLL